MNLIGTSCFCQPRFVVLRCIQLSLVVVAPVIGQSQPEDGLQAATRFDNDGRVAFMQNQLDDAVVAFHKALRLLNAEDDADSERDDFPLGWADVVASARVHLGVVAYKRGAWEESVRFFRAAHGIPGVLAGDFLKRRSWPYDEGQLSETVRWFVKCYAESLHRASLDKDARLLWERAALAGVVRDKWQCSLTLSPASWALRMKPWWGINEVKVVRKLATVLKRNHNVIKDETTDVLVHRQVPSGVRLSLNQEVEAVRSGQWLELILFKNGVEVPMACAAMPRLCEVLRPFTKLFHTNGQVKLSHFIGGTSGHPHCGPIDTKLRMHFAVLLPPDSKVRLARLSVAGKSKRWSEGRSFLFDDSMEHSVVFDADADAHRVILIADFWHPDVPMDTRLKQEL